MIELEPVDYRKAAPLLERAPFNVLMAQAVAAGRVGGRIFADSPDPSSVYVRHKYGMSWLIGNSIHGGYDQAVVEFVANPTVRTAPEWLQVYPLDWTETIDPLVATGALKSWHRTNFWFNQARFQRYFARGGGNTVRCTKDDVERFEGSVVPKHFWDSTAEFIDSGAGFFALTTGGDVAAIAFASYLDAANLEVGVETLPVFRGQGHAQAACARILYHCIDNGLNPVWSCRTENVGSFRLAEKVGFVPVLEIPYYELPYTSAE